MGKCVVTTHGRSCFWNMNLQTIIKRGNNITISISLLKTHSRQISNVGEKWISGRSILYLCFTIISLKKSWNYYAFYSKRRFSMWYDYYIAMLNQLHMSPQNSYTLILAMCSRLPRAGYTSCVKVKSLVVSIDI